MESKKFLYLSRKSVEQILTMKDTIDLMEKAFTQLSRGKAKVPVRMNMSISEDRDCSLIMPVCLNEEGTMGIKWVSINNKNPARGLPLIHAMVLLFDLETGAPLALLDGEYITAMRTGAASGLATRLVANKNAEVLALFGAGVQAKYQLEATRSVLSLKKVLLFNRDQTKGQKFAEEMTALFGIEVSRSERPEELKEADIICTATNSSTPVFSAANVGPAVHINGVGSYNRSMREVPNEIVEKAQIIVDHRLSAFKEAGDLAILKNSESWKNESRILELGELCGNPKLIESNFQGITFFKSVGNAVQDLVTATHVYHLAVERGLGQELST